MPDSVKQVMLPFANLPTTDALRRAISNVIQDIQREHDLTDLQLAEAVGVHFNTIERARNKKVTLDNLSLTRIGARYGMRALEAYTALWGQDCAEHGEPIALLADAMAALARAKGPKGQMDALPVVKKCAEGMASWALETERKRLRLVG